MYSFGQALTNDKHFADHIGINVPVQIYKSGKHSDIGFVQEVSPAYVKVNGHFYHRDRFRFVSRPGY